MKLKTEVKNVKQKILIVDKNLTPFLNNLKSEFKKYDIEIFTSPKMPEDLTLFDYCFFVNEFYPLEKLNNIEYKKIIFIFLNKKKQIEKYVPNIEQQAFKNIKIINISGDENFIKSSMEKILWFSFSKSNEIFLNLNQLLVKKTVTPSYSLLKKFLSLARHKKFLLNFIILFIVLYHLIFIPPLISSSFFFYQAAKNIKENKIERSIEYNKLGQFFLPISKKLYSFCRPTFLLFSVAFIPDDIIQINEKTDIIIQRSIVLYENSKKIIELALKKDKSSQEKNLLLLRLEKIKNNLAELEENINFVNQKIPNSINDLKKIKQDLSLLSDTVTKFKKILVFSDYLLAKNSEKKYLLFFANNMELRPGGGFIGSFGILSIKDLTLNDLKIYDVYDADGQLIAHIEPPTPIRKYLSQPHWFLRDSAFSADFYDNYLQAKLFLEKEVNLSDFSGGILLTTTAIQNLLDAFGNLYLPDFKEIVNKDNFYLKAQFYAENNFFPGSTQKKSFLSSLTRQILINLENVSSKELAVGIKKSLDDKQLVAYFDEPELQKIIDSYYWSGRVIKSQCPSNLENCIADYIFPIDANLGVNKVNFFINRFMEIKINIDQGGNFNNSIILKYKNNSQNEVFPGGRFKNYFQLLLPKNSVVKKITKNDILVEEYDEINDQIGKKVGFFFEVEPQTTAEIKIEYYLLNQLIKGKAVYQLLVQKQIGSSNTDLILKINLPKNISLFNQNFSPLVKDNQIIYNTNLSADKIFFIELIKD